MTESDLHKWGNYFRYFYFDEEMSFSKFLELLEQGRVPTRSKVDWNRIKGAYEEEQSIC